MTDTLWQSFSNALTAVAEAEAVQAAIETAVLEGGLGNVRGSDDEWDYQYWWDEDENVASYWIQSRSRPSRWCNFGCGRGPSSGGFGGDV